MEEFKDVMLSEPPSRFAAAPAVQSMSLENYKGILLCDRPTAGAVGKGAGGSANDGPIPFLPAGKGDDRYVGLQPSIEARSRYELSRSMRLTNKVSKPSAMTRHKKWLFSFANAVKKMQLDKVEKQLEDEENQKKLREKQQDERMQRQAALEAQPTQQPAPAKEVAKVETQTPKVTVTNTKTNAKVTSSGGATKKKTKAKPKWAMTEDEALREELNENDELVNFAESLNFEKFIDDYEVREALAIMRDRVKEIAAEEGIDLAEVQKNNEDNDDTSSVTTSEAPSDLSAAALEERRNRKREAKVAKKAKEASDSSPEGAENRPEWNSTTSVTDKLRGAISHDATSLAEKLLASTPSLGQIYTKYTLGRMLQDAAISTINEGTTRLRAEGASKVPILPPVAPPVVSVVSAESLATGEQKQKRILVELRKKKDHVQNLPYMYRCPSL